MVLQGMQGLSSMSGGGGGPEAGLVGLILVPIYCACKSHRGLMAPPLKGPLAGLFSGLGFGPSHPSEGHQPFSEGGVATETAGLSDSGRSGDSAENPSEMLAQLKGLSDKMSSVQDSVRRARAINLHGEQAVGDRAAPVPLSFLHPFDRICLYLTQPDRSAR